MLAGVLLHAGATRAQVATNITSSGLGTTVVNPPGTTTYDITGGTRSGNGQGPNLFHSFGLFNVGPGDTANFSNDSGLVTSNILGRVTDGQTSSIFGRIQTTNFGSANLFLINPAGWIFGSTASLNVSGAFHVSTADYIRLIDGAMFDATTTQAQALLMSAPPAAFGFLSANPVRISVDGSSLRVASGNTLSLVGGEAAFSGEAETGLRIAGVAPGSATPTLLAPSGQIQIVSVASPGEVTLNGDVSSFATLGRIDLVNGALINVSGVNGPGGTVVIRGGQLFAGESARIVANTTGATNGAATAVDVQVSGQMSLTGSSGIDVQTSDSGAAGEVRIAAGSLELSGAAFIRSITSNGGAGGAIVIDVGTLALNSGGSVSSTSSGGFGELSGGPGGDVIVTATESVTLDGEGGGISAITLSELPDGSGTGGRLGISTRNLALDNGARLTVSSSGTGAAGDLVVDVGSVTLANGATFRSRTIDAPGGAVTVKAASLVEINGAGSGIFSGSAGAGSVGEITVNTAQLTLAGGVIQSGNSLDPDGGNVTVVAADSIVISDGGGISSQALSGNLGTVTIDTRSLLIDTGFIFNNTKGFFPAGDISVNVQTLTLSNGGQITSSSDFGASGNGGNISVAAADSVYISGTLPPDFVPNPFDPRQLLGLEPRSGIFSTSLESGAGGSITVQAGQAVELTNFGAISAQSFGFNDAGQITVLAPTLTAADGAAISVATLFDGKAGHITLDVGNLTLTGGARISSSTFGNGAGGNITVSANQVSIQNGGQVVAESGGLFLDVPTVGTGSGGSVSISADTTITVSDPGSAVSTTTFGDGRGGGVTLSAAQVNVQNGGTVTSESGGVLVDSLGGVFVMVGSGASGSVSISDAQAITVSGLGSAVSTTTFGNGTGGDVALSANQVNIQNGGRVTSESGGLLGSVVAVGTGNGGTVTISASDAITVSGQDSVVSTSTSGAGQGGSIALTGMHVDILAGGRVTAEASGTGDAGTVTITATGANTLTISGAGSTVSTSTLGDGDGGNVVLGSAGEVRISDGGSVTADSLGGDGRTGRIDITAGSSIVMDNGTISTRAVTSDGGDIKLTAPNVVQLSDSKITTSVESGIGSGGNIKIDPQFVILNNSTIIANAFGGPGGNITIIADNFLRSATTVIEASSALSTPGTIQIQSPDNNIESSIAQLPAAFLDASALLRGLCTARRTGAPSSFVVAGRGGVPVDADGYLPSFGTDVAAGMASADAPARAEAGHLDGTRLALALAMRDYLDCSR